MSKGKTLLTKQKKLQKEFTKIQNKRRVFEITKFTIGILWTKVGNQEQDDLGVNTFPSIRRNC